MPDSVQVILGVEVDLTGKPVSKTPFDAAKFLEEGRGGFTDDQIKAAFDLVADPDHWKNPIDAIIDRGQQEVVAVAISWYTATPAEFEETDDPDKVRVIAEGYFNGPAGP
jgi:hypothetical protein